MRKRIIYFIMSIILAMGTMAVFSTNEVKAASQAESLVSMAKSQLGIKERSSGSDDISYNDWYYGRRVNNNGVSAKYAWCAVFVSWCANQAGIPTSIIPKTANTTDMKNRLINSGGTSHLKGSGYTPKCGDIIFFGSNASQHVGIVEYSLQNTVYYIDGNNTQTNPHGVHYSSCSLSYSSLWGFVTPNYTISAPVNPQISKNQYWYDIKDRIELTAYADGATSYFMSIFKDGNKIISQSVEGGRYAFDASAYGYGNYSAYFSCSNSAGSVDTKWTDFSVVEAATYSDVYVSNKWYDLTDIVSIRVDTICAKGQVIGIDKEGVGRVITENTDSVYEIEASRLGTGKYSAYFSVYNGSGGVDTARVEFEIVDKPKKGATISTTKEKYSLGDKVEISVDVECAKGKVIGIDREGSGRIITEEVRGTKYCINASQLGTGNYSAYFSVYNSSGGYDTKSVTFQVMCSHNYVLKTETQPECTDSGLKIYECRNCGNQYTETIPASGHQHTQLRNAKEATCTVEGFTGDMYCLDCRQKISDGEAIPRKNHTAVTDQAVAATCTLEGKTQGSHCKDCGAVIKPQQTIPKTNHSWNNGEVTVQATASADGIRTYTCISCGEIKTEKIPAFGQTGNWEDYTDSKGENEGSTNNTDLICDLEVGDEIEDNTGTAEYEVISVSGSDVCVEYAESINEKARVIKIPDTIKTEDGIVCKVTAISKGTFKNNRKIKKVLIGNHITIIGAKAFYGCRNLTSVQLGESVTVIGNRTFYGCRKLKKLNVKTELLSSSGLHKKAFQGIPEKTIVQVPKNMKKCYEKLLCQKGLSSKNMIR